MFKHVVLATTCLNIKILMRSHCEGHVETNLVLCQIILMKNILLLEFSTMNTKQLNQSFNCSDSVTTNLAETIKTKSGF